MDNLQLIEAVKANNVAAVKELIESGADLNQQDEQGWTPLCWAAGKGDPEIVGLLIERGADPSKVGRDQRTPYKIALAAGNAKVVMLLRDAEAKNKGAASVPQRPWARAYLLSELRQFPAWSDTDETKEDETTSEPRVVFLHHDLTVTSSMWHNENVVFDNVTPEWQEFCQNVLGFRVPDDIDLIVRA